MKLDLNAAWDQAIRLIGMNREVMLILAGVFFFLPPVLFTWLIPMPDLQAAAAPTGEGTSALAAALNGFLRQYWWAILLLSAVQIAGSLAVMAVLGDPRRPTVQAAIARGFALLPTGLMASLLASLAAISAVFVAILAGAITASELLAKTFALAAVPLAFWVWTSLSLNAPAIGIEKIANPLAALRRSWRLTEGSRFRLAMFYLLLLIAFVVIFQVAGLIVGLLVALLSAETATAISALLLGIVQAIFSLLFFAVQASVHRLLARAERTAAPDPA